MKPIWGLAILMGECKRRLFICACARKAEKYIKSGDCLKVLAMAERVALDLPVDDYIYRKLHFDAYQLYQNTDNRLRSDARYLVSTASRPSHLMTTDVVGASNCCHDVDPDIYHKDVITCLCTNLGSYYKKVFPPYLKEMVKEIWSDRKWEIIPIIADALEDHDEQEMAEHLRNDKHWLGCWVLNAIIGVSQ